MNMFILVVLILAFRYEFVFSQSSQLSCVAQRNESQNFILTSERNATGHWIAKVHIQHGGSNGTGVGSPVEVQLKHNTVSCISKYNPQVDAQISSPPSVRPSPGPDYFPSSQFGYYKRHSEQMTWMDAKNVCEKEGTHLLIINSVEEALEVLQLFGRSIFNKPRSEWDREAWVGIIDMKEEGNFETVFGLPLKDTGYEMWGPGEPNNHNEEDCIAILRNGLYNDRKCDGILDFICELEY